MEGARAVFALSLFQGYTGSQSEAMSAYTQAFFKGRKTMVHLPRNRWPTSWAKLGYDDPVVPLVLDLYGHPDDGTQWEERCNDALLKCGWKNLAYLGWASVYWHEGKQALLVVYVGDCIMAAPAQCKGALWEGFRRELTLEPPEDPGRFLGCNLLRFDCTAKDMEPILARNPDL